MSAYIARLKQIDRDNFINTPYTEPTEPTKGSFDGSVGEGMGHIVKNNTDIEIIHLNNDSKKCTIGEPTKPTKGYEGIVSNWWLIHFVDLEPVQVAIWPPCNHAGALASYPKAIAAEPIPSPHTQAVNIDTPQALLDLMRAGGYSVSVKGDRLEVSQAQWIDAELADLITSHKIGLIKILESEAT